MTPDQIQTYGDELFEAWSTRSPIEPLRLRVPNLTIDDAYRIQERMVARRLQRTQETIIGKKIGVTSKAVQDMLGVDRPDFGQLTSKMAYEHGQDVPLDALIQPRAEAEVAFVLKRDLIGPGITATDVIRATDYVVPCFEVVDSRIRNWDIKIQDTIADNASCGVFLLSNCKALPTALDLTLAGMVLEKNGQLFSTAAGAAVQGGPVNAVVWLANTLGALGIPFRAGEVILSGSQSTLIPVVPGDQLRCTVGGLGSCDIRFTGAQS